MFNVAGTYGIYRSVREHAVNHSHRILNGSTLIRVWRSNERETTLEAIGEFCDDQLICCLF